MILQRAPQGAEGMQTECAMTELLSFLCTEPQCQDTAGMMIKTTRHQEEELFQVMVHCQPLRLRRCAEEILTHVENIPGIYIDGRDVELSLSHNGRDGNAESEV
jgi:hypothetical protein